MVWLFIVAAPVVMSPTPSQTTRRSHSSTSPRDDARSAGRWRPGGSRRRSACDLTGDPERPMRGGVVYSGAESATDRRASHPDSARTVGRTPPSRRRPDRPGSGGKTSDRSLNTRPMRGAALRASLAMVLRVTSGMIGATTSLAPEPTTIVSAAPRSIRSATLGAGAVARLHAGDPRRARHRRTTRGWRRAGEGTHQDVTAGRQHDRDPGPGWG